MASADQLLRWLCRTLSPLTPAGAVTPVQPADWRMVMALADQHLLLPELYLAALRHGPALNAPAEVVETLEAVHFLNADRNGRLRDQMQHLSLALTRAGIRHVWLKGAVWLLEDGWASSGRIMNDLDLWFPDPESHGDALRLLDGMGYRPMAGFQDEDWHMSHHYAPRISDDWPVRVEPHRHVIDPRFAALLPDDEVRRDAIWQEWEGARIGVPSTGHRLLHALVQASVMAVPDFGTGRSPMMKALDVVRIAADEGWTHLPPPLADQLATDGWLPWSRPFLTITDRLLGLPSPLPADERVFNRQCLVANHPRLALLIEMWARVADGRLFRRLARPDTLPDLVRRYSRILRTGRDFR